MFNSIRASKNGLALNEFLMGHTDIARRIAQRLIAQLIESGQVTADNSSARRYFGAGAKIGTNTLAGRADNFSHLIALSADIQEQTGEKLRIMLPYGNNS